MWGKLCVLVLLAAAASADPIRVEESAIEPLFQCRRIWDEELASDFKEKLYRKIKTLNSTDIPWLTEEDHEFIIQTAIKIKPVIVEALNETCALINEDGTVELIEKTQRMIKSREQEKAFEIFTQKVKLGDVQDSLKLVEKMKVVIRSVMEFEKITLTEDEKTRFINISDRVLDILRKLHDGLTTILYDLTIEQYMKLTRVFSTIANQMFHGV